MVEKVQKVRNIMSYIYRLPPSVAFRAKGLFGYSFGPLKQKDVEILYIESEKGHDTFMVCTGLTRTYYVLAGEGSFTIDGCAYGVEPGVLVEVPSGVEYSYSGRMTMLAFCKRGRIWKRDRWTRWNRDVVGREDPWPLAQESWRERLVRIRIFGKSPTNAFLRINQRLWNILPSFLVALRPVDRYGHFLHALARIQGVRAQAFNTFFLRNRPELELIRRLAGSKKRGETVRVAVLGCSAGAEVYSIAWAIRTARPDLRLILQAVDISEQAVEFARRGVYPFRAEVGDQAVYDQAAAGCWLLGSPGSHLVGAEVFERMTAAEKTELFDLDQNAASVKAWIKEGIQWHVADVKTPELLGIIGMQDIVVASNFLCHMEDSEAARCLRNIARLIAPQGHILVSGVDLDVRTNVARELGWQPVEDLIEEIHNGDDCMREIWPCHYGGLEPLNKAIPDWKLRYAAAFSMPAATEHTRTAQQNELVHG
jgi:chemotaxis methyl-accepting protein methylase